MTDPIAEAAREIRAALHLATVGHPTAARRRADAVAILGWALNGDPRRLDDIAAAAGVEPLTLLPWVADPTIRLAWLRAERDWLSGRSRQVADAIRVYAVEQVTAGRTHEDVATEIGVKRPTVSGWWADHQQRQAADVEART